MSGIGAVSRVGSPDILATRVARQGNRPVPAPPRMARGRGSGIVPGRSRWPGRGEFNPAEESTPMRTHDHGGLLGLPWRLCALARGRRAKAIFDGTRAGGWMTNNAQAPARGQHPGGRPQSARLGGLHRRPRPAGHGDFVLDFDYKLSKGCNSGVFLRVGDLKDPVIHRPGNRHRRHQGHRPARPGRRLRPGPPRTNAQKPAGEWNHMTITAKGPVVTDRPERREVSKIDLEPVRQAGQAARRLVPQVRQRRHQGPANDGLPRVPGSRARLLVQEHQAENS